MPFLVSISIGTVLFFRERALMYGIKFITYYNYIHSLNTHLDVLLTGFLHSFILWYPIAYNSSITLTCYDNGTS